jgi:hypothetical protein
MSGLGRIRPRHAVTSAKTTTSWAVKNSESPVTQEFAGRMAALADGSPTFYDLDVIEERTS